MANNIGSASSNPCSNGHVVVWAGDPYAKLPEGFPCACGATVIHWQRCEHCGHERYVLVEEKP